MAGFELAVNPMSTKAFPIVAKEKGETEFKPGDIPISEPTRPKLLFIHVAKTGGTSANAFFSRQYPEDRIATHVESNPEWFANPEYRGKLEFISGHISYHKFANWLDLSRYHTTTLVREPYSQIISHLAWIKFLSEPSESDRFAVQEEYVKTLSRKLWHTDLTDEGQIRRFVEGLQGPEQGLLDNCQTRYFSSPEPGEAVDEKALNLATRTTDEFGSIGTTDAIDQFIRDVSRVMSWGCPKQFARENVSKTHYGLDPTNLVLCAALEPLVKYDLALYNHVKEKLASRVSTAATSSVSPPWPNPASASDDPTPSRFSDRIRYLQDRAANASRMIRDRNFGLFRDSLLMEINHGIALIRMWRNMRKDLRKGSEPGSAYDNRAKLRSKSWRPTVNRKLAPPNPSVDIEAISAELSRIQCSLAARDHTIAGQNTWSKSPS